MGVGELSWTEIPHCCVLVAAIDTDVTMLLHCCCHGQSCCIVASWLLMVPATGNVYLSDGSPWAILHAATLRSKLPIKLAHSPVEYRYPANQS